MKANSVRVAITGLGSVSAAGLGREAIAAHLAAGRPRLTEVDRKSGFHLPSGSRTAALVTLPNFRPWLSPRAARRMSRPSKLCVVAAKLAVEDAALEDERDFSSTAVSVATAFGPTEFSERIVRTMLTEGPDATSPALFTESVANAPAAQVALAFGARGPNITVTQREAGSLIAVATAAREVASGRSELALAATVDEVNPLLHALLDRFGALARPGENGSEVARPFDRRRSGYLLAEGATALVLESEDRARQRSVQPLAILRLSVAGFDPDAPQTGWSRSPAKLGSRLAEELERAEIDPAQISRVVSGASGSRAGDRLEAGVLRTAWGETSLPDVLTPKAIVGEAGGGHLAAAILTASGAGISNLPSAGFEDDPEVGIRPAGAVGSKACELILVSALSTGGSAAWAILEAAE